MAFICYVFLFLGWRDIQYTCQRLNISDEGTVYLSDCISYRFLVHHSGSLFLNPNLSKERIVLELNPHFTSVQYVWMTS